MSDFLDKNYELPVSESKYLKFQKGENRFRFLTSPIIGWEYFVKEEDGKSRPVRSRPNSPKPDIKHNPKHFWAAVVYDWSSLSIKILEITQKTIQSQIIDLNANPKWGSPKDYDLCIVRKGDGMETEYTVQPEPKTPVLEGASEEAAKVVLDALYEGEDPFINLAK